MHWRLTSIETSSFRRFGQERQRAGRRSSKCGLRVLIRTSGVATSLENLLTSLWFGWQKKPKQTAWCSIGPVFLIPPKLDPHAHVPNSRTLVFAKDRLTPTYREICGQAFDVSFYERLYAPMDGSGKSLPTINEAIHRRVIERYQKQALICSDDQNGACITTPYRPRNVAPLLDANFQIKMGLRVEGY